MSTRDKPVNPYNYGRPISDPEQFYGREQTIRDIYEYIDKCECVNIVGERRSGKTSLLFRLQDPERLRASGVDSSAVFVYIDAEISPQNPEGFFREVFREAKRQSPQLTIDLGDDNQPVTEQRVRALFDAIRPHRLVVLIDEFECISQCESFPPRFFVFLRGLSFCYDISFVISTRRRLFECCTPEVVTSPFPNIFKTVEIGPFSHAEYRDLVETTSTISGVDLVPYQDDVARLAGYSPYLVQMACWHYFDVCAERGGLDPDAEVVARRRFSAEAEAHFDAVWSRYLSDEERTTLQHVVRGEDDPRPNVVWRLENKGYITESGISSDAFAAFVRRQTLQEDEAASVAQGIPDSGLWVDVASGNVYVDGVCLDPPLTKHQFRLVKLLFESKGKICSSYMIVKAVWSEEYMDQVGRSAHRAAYQQTTEEDRASRQALALRRPPCTDEV